MPKNLPEKLSGSIPSLSERAALFADPPSLLSMDPGTLRDLAAEVAVEAGPIMKQVRTMVGLVSWALRSKVPAGEFGAWIQSYSELVGVSVRTLHEWRVQATEQVGIVDPYKSKRGPKAAGESGRLAESRQSPKVIPAASTEAPAKSSAVGEGPSSPAADPSSEGGGQDGETRPAPPCESPSGKSLEGVGKNGEGSPSHSAPGDSIARPGSPAPSDSTVVEITESLIVTPSRPPSDRQLTARVFAAMREVDPTDAGPVTTPEEATFLRQWAQRTLDAWRAKNGIERELVNEKPQRRQGTITRPADRLNGTAGRPSAPVVIPTARIGGKRHADDCSCLSCATPKAAAK